MHIANKIDKQSGIFYLKQDCLTINTRKQFTTLMYPYCNTVWGAVCQTTVKPVVIAQKRAMRTITGLRRYEHTHNSFCTLRLLKCNEINTYFCVLFVYKSLNIYSDHIFHLRNSGIDFDSQIN